MTLRDEINNLPAAVGEGSTGHLGNHSVIHEALKVHDADIQTAMASADTASTTVQNVEARVTSVEAMAGLSPESPVDGQTADLISQQGTLTRAALMDVGHGTFLAKRAAVHSTFLGTPDGTLPIRTDSGHEWGYLVAADMEVRDGYLRSKQGGLGSGSHAEVSLDGPVTRMGMVFRFNSEGGTRTTKGYAAINAWADGGIAAGGGGRRSRAHVDLTRTTCGLGVRAVEGVGKPIEQVGGRYTFPTPLEVDKWYTLEWYISGDTAVVIMPDGHVHVATDPRIQSIPATFADFQLTDVPDADSLITEIRQVWADSSPTDSDSSGSMAFQALTTAAEGEPPTPNGKYIEVYDRGGVPQSVLGMSTMDTVILKNGSASAPSAEIRLLKDGGLDFAIGNTVQVSLQADGSFYPRKIVLDTVGRSLTSGSGSPEGVLAERTGSVYIQYDGRRGQSLWQREIAGENNTGWRPVGHPAGFTNQRPGSPVVGLSYFDIILGKPIWWSGTEWVDANGVNADEPPAGE